MSRYCCAFLFVSLAGSCWAQGRPVNVEIPANQSWTSTGIYLNPGETVLIEARGVIEAVPPSDTRPMFHRVPPAGRQERQGNKPQPTMPALVMLARIGDGPVLEAGARAEFRAGGRNGSGELQLGINDDYVADNTGSWTARITFLNASLSQQQRPGRIDGDGRRQGRNDDDGQRQGRYADEGQGRREMSAGVAAIRSKEQQLGALLGPATAEIRMTADGVGRYREYQNGAIYWSPDTGAHEIHGSIRDEWRQRGAETGDLGYPTSDEVSTRNGRSRESRFQRGVIRWDVQNGARVEQLRN